LPGWPRYFVPEFRWGNQVSRCHVVALVLIDFREAAYRRTKAAVFTVAQCGYLKLTNQGIEPSHRKERRSVTISELSQVLPAEVSLQNIRFRAHQCQTSRVVAKPECHDPVVRQLRHNRKRRGNGTLVGDQRIVNGNRPGLRVDYRRLNEAD
jgi:hypothetical protein